ncbi:hypothetical protein GF351_00745, partial [Candidatus Woesearchaeota archaeon]|nr:hypothetical protein [Candidatus Woesearchaeota archaeon]
MKRRRKSRKKPERRKKTRPSEPQRLTPSEYQEHYNRQMARYDASKPRYLQKPAPLPRQAGAEHRQSAETETRASAAYPQPRPHEYKPSPQPMPYRKLQGGPQMRPKPKKGFRLKLNWLHKLLILSFVIFLIWVNKEGLSALGMKLLNIHPAIYNLYYYVYSEVISRTLKGLFMIAGIGALFFVFIPVEVIFIAYLGYGYNPVTVMLVAVIGYCL